MTGEPQQHGFVKVDRVGSTADWGNLPAAQVTDRRARFFAGVNECAREFSAIEPFHWQGDGVMLFVTGDEVPARTFALAKAIRDRAVVDLNMTVRVAAHAAWVVPQADPGQLASPAIDACGHLEHVAPVNAVAMSEDLALAVRTDEMAPLGVTERDGLAAWVWPADARARRPAEGWRAEDDLAPADQIRRYVNAPEIRLLRYVGFRLHRAAPALDLDDVFVPPEISTRRPDTRELLRDRPELEALTQRLGLEPDTFSAPASSSRRLADALRDARVLVLLGDPGAGKTTTARWLALAAARGRFAWQQATGLDEAWIPLPISVGGLAELRRGAPELTAPAAIGRYLAARHCGDAAGLTSAIERWLDAGQALVLLDGLDEVREAERLDVHRWLETFAARYHRARFLVTSRVVGYTGFAGSGAEGVVEPFSDEAVERYVRSFMPAYLRWETGRDEPERAAEAADELLKELRANERLGALARNPFMLSALALIHRAEGKLPAHRVRAYDILAGALCETWGDVRRLVVGSGGARIPYEEEAIPILGALAAKMMVDHPNGAAPEAVVLDTLAAAIGGDPTGARKTAKEFLRRAGEEVQILVERGPGHWGFVHLTFQEFFAVAGYAANEELENKCLEHLLDPRWFESIRLGVAYLAIVQRRTKVAQRLIEAAINLERSDDWRASALRLNVPIATVIATELGDGVPPALALSLATSFAEWASNAPSLAIVRFGILLRGTALATAIADIDWPNGAQRLEFIRWSQAYPAAWLYESALKDTNTGGQATKLLARAGGSLARTLYVQRIEHRETIAMNLPSDDVALVVDHLPERDREILALWRVGIDHHAPSVSRRLEAVAFDATDVELQRAALRGAENAGIPLDLAHLCAMVTDPDLGDAAIGAIGVHLPAAEAFVHLMEYLNEQATSMGAARAFVNERTRLSDSQVEEILRRVDPQTNGGSLLLFATLPIFLLADRRITTADVDSMIQRLAPEYGIMLRGLSSLLAIGEWNFSDPIIHAALSDRAAPEGTDPASHIVGVLKESSDDSERSHLLIALWQLSGWQNIVSIKPRPNRNSRPMHQ